MTLWQDFKRGLILENPLLRLMIGLCSALAVSTRMENGIFLGIAATFVLVMSNIIVAAIKKATPHQIRIPIFIVVIASFVTIVDLVMRAYFPPIYERLGIWIPLIVVNCMILGRAEAFAYKHGVLRAIFDGLGAGFGFTGVLLIMGLVREILGTGQIIAFDTTIVNLGRNFDPPRIMVAFPGAFLTFGLLIAALNWIQARGRTR